MAHVIVLEGTSRLDEVSRYLAQNDNVVSVISKSREVLDQYAEIAGKFAGKINLIIDDFLDKEKLKNKLAEAVKRYGPVTLVVSWISRKARAISMYLVEFLNTSSPVCRFFEIQGSKSDDHSDDFKDYDRVLYRRISLRNSGIHAGKNGLDPRVITLGVIDAIREDHKNAIVGGE